MSTFVYILLPFPFMLSPPLLRQDFPIPKVHIKLGVKKWMNFDFPAHMRLNICKRYSNYRIIFRWCRCRLWVPSICVVHHWHHWVHRRHFLPHWVSHQIHDMSSENKIFLWAHEPHWFPCINSILFVNIIRGRWFHIL